MSYLENYINNIKRSELENMVEDYLNYYNTFKFKDIKNLNIYYTIGEAWSDHIYKRGSPDLYTWHSYIDDWFHKKSYKFKEDFVFEYYNLISKNNDNIYDIRKYMQFIYTIAVDFGVNVKHLPDLNPFTLIEQDGSTNYNYWNGRIKLL